MTGGKPFNENEYNVNARILQGKMSPMKKGVLCVWDNEINKIIVFKLLQTNINSRLKQSIFLSKF